METPKHYSGNGMGLTCKQAQDAVIAQHCVYSDTALFPMAWHYWMNAFEYLWRWSCKNGVEDLRKAQHEIELLIAEVGE